MGKSRKKTPIHGLSKSESDKEFKKISNKKFRAKEQSAMASGEFDHCPKRNFEAMESYTFPKDGKRWFDDGSETAKKMMRK